MCNLDYLERAIRIIDHWSLGEGVLLYLVCVLGSQEVQGNSSDLQKIITTLHYFSLEMFSLSSHEWEWCEGSLGGNDTNGNI